MVQKGWLNVDDLEARLNGRDLFGDPITPAYRGPVADRFGFPPFSVLDARQGEWKERKRAWISAGIQSEIGRETDLCYKGLAATLDYFGVQNGTRSSSLTQETSLFDPTLCECLYRWFCPEGGQIIDPFAGGSVRGIVAGMLGMKYWGCDLRREQIDANVAQGNSILPQVMPEWCCGDSMETLSSSPLADFVFSCPPYGDLEKYSDAPEDLSSMEWHTFSVAYPRLISQAVKRLKENRFACFVVGDFRDKRGFYRDFVSLTIAGFRDAGAKLYNEAILVTSVGTAALRVTKQFNSGRKFAKTHQNVLVFCKGDWKKAAQAINEQKQY